MKLSGLVVLVAATLALGATDVARGEVVLQYDDGGYEISGALHGEAVRFDLPAADHPWQVEQISVFLRGGVLSTDNYDVSICIWEDDGGPPSVRHW